MEGVHSPFSNRWRLSPSRPAECYNHNTLSPSIEFFEPEEMSRPQSEVRIASLSARPYPDGRRVRVHIGLTPFAQRPNLDIRVLNAAGESVASANVVEAIEREMELTLHLRGDAPAGAYLVRASLYYGDSAAQHTLEAAFDAPPATG